MDFYLNLQCFELRPDLIETKSSGIMDLLNEEGKLPKSSEEHFTTEVHQRHGKHFRLAVRSTVFVPIWIYWSPFYDCAFQHKFYFYIEQHLALPQCFSIAFYKAPLRTPININKTTIYKIVHVYMFPGVIHAPLEERAPPFEKRCFRVFS